MPDTLDPVDRILGQPDAIATIEAAWRSGRFPHAWIFSGPRGVGKFTTALALAVRLLGGQSAGLIAAGTHPDLHVIRKELAAYSDDPKVRSQKLTNIPVAVVRQWITGGLVDEHYHEPAVYKTPVLGVGKVFIVDEAELLSAEAQDTMLKTLEEPPRLTYIVLVTTRPQQLLATVHSRCRHVTFGPLDDAAMRAWTERGGLESQGPERDWVLSFAAGSPGTAVLADRAKLYRWHTALRPMLAELDRGAYPQALGETLAALIDEFAVAWVKSHQNASKTAASREGAALMLSLLASHARRRLAGGGPAGATALAAIDLIHAAETHVARNVNAKLALENLVVQWTAAAESPAVGT